MHDPGARSDCIVDQVAHYVKFWSYCILTEEQINMPSRKVLILISPTLVESVDFCLHRSVVANIDWPCRLTPGTVICNSNYSLAFAVCLG